MNQTIEVQLHKVSSLEIHQYLTSHPDIIPQLLPHATISTIVHLARSNPQGFTAYCTISNTVKAIGIGGSASLYLSAKITPFLTQSLVTLSLLPAAKVFVCSWFPVPRNFVSLSFTPSVLYVPTGTVCIILGEALRTLISLSNFSLNLIPHLTLNPPYLTKPLGFLHIKLRILDNGIFFRSPCTFLSKDNPTFSLSAFVQIFRNLILGKSFPVAPGEARNQIIGHLRDKVVEAYWQMVRSMDSSLEWTIAWSLIGEWTSRELFLPPKGTWPRNCHPAKFHMPCDQRSTPVHTWARACFEQGSLPSLLAIPGKAAMLVSPGQDVSIPICYRGKLDLLSCMAMAMRKEL